MQLLFSKKKKKTLCNSHEYYEGHEFCFSLVFSPCPSGNGKLELEIFVRYIQLEHHTQDIALPLSEDLMSLTYIHIQVL